MSNKILENEIFSNDGRENIRTATHDAITPESGMSYQIKVILQKAGGWIQRRR